jgi:hypothetical protein
LLVQLDAVAGKVDKGHVCLVSLALELLEDGFHCHLLKIGLESYRLEAGVS